MKFIEIVRLALAVVVCQLAGAVGSLFTRPAIPTWYAGLEKPFFTPPSWVFGPVWITLYLLMGIAAFLVWNKGWDRADVRAALAVFGLQLLLNVAWSALFFGLRSPLLGLVDIVLLWLAILLTAYLFFQISRPAGYLLLPYLLWVTYAAALNFSLWRLNS
ncbi:MAG: tryptophan-rich sensory protein [Candidatus Zixiibacteriota bacterium]|nr:MAG: tryptophan-rich sensory protein [candidate division Zixibacteria bacterium]